MYTTYAYTLIYTYYTVSFVFVYMYMYNILKYLS